MKSKASSRWHVVNAFFVPMPFVPVLCQFFSYDDVKLRALMGTIEALFPSRTQVDPVQAFSRWMKVAPGGLPEGHFTLEAP